MSVKIRAGWAPGQPGARVIAGIIEDCGADAIALHPRFVVQRFSGAADWGIISEVKSEVRIPVIGNGDVRSPGQALDMVRLTGCDGVMIGRGAVGNPWIFKEISALEAGAESAPPQLDERKGVILAHFDMLVDHMGEERAVRVMRGLLVWYTKGLPLSSRFRTAFTGVRDRKGMTGIMDQYFSLLGGALSGLTEAFSTCTGGYDP